MFDRICFPFLLIRRNSDRIQTQICDQETRLLGFGIGLEQVSGRNKIHGIRYSKAIAAGLLLQRTSNTRTRTYIYTVLRKRRLVDDGRTILPGQPKWERVKFPDISEAKLSCAPNHICHQTMVSLQTLKCVRWQGEREGGRE